MSSFLGDIEGAQTLQNHQILIQGGPGSVRLRFGDGTVRAVRVFGSGGSSKEGFLCVSVQFSREDGSGFGSPQTVLAVPVPRSVPGKTVPTVPVSGSGSVPGPPCQKYFNRASSQCSTLLVAIHRPMTRRP